MTSARSCWFTSGNDPWRVLSVTDYAAALLGAANADPIGMAVVAPPSLGEERTMTAGLRMFPPWPLPGPAVWQARKGALSH